MSRFCGPSQTRALYHRGITGSVLAPALPYGVAMKAITLALTLAAAACSNEPVAGSDGTGRCTAMIMDGDACNQVGEGCNWSEGIDSGSVSPLHRCTCLGNEWRCTTIANPCPGGGIPSSEATCNDGDACDYSDWEHDCFCGCASNHRWDCAPGTIGSYQVCPRAFLDAGVD
jgi:hypothetical protein